MKCYFCDDDDITMDNYEAIGSPYPGKFTCECGTEYSFHYDGSLYSYSFSAYYNKHYYSGVYFVDAGKLSGTFHVKDDVYKTVARLDLDPKINPTNFLKKLPTLLIFS